MIIKLVKERNTKRMTRYSEVDGNALGSTGSFYIDQIALRSEFGEIPEKLVLEVKKS